MRPSRQHLMHKTATEPSAKSGAHLPTHSPSCCCSAVVQQAHRIAQRMQYQGCLARMYCCLCGRLGNSMHCSFFGDSNRWWQGQNIQFLQLSREESSGNAPFCLYASNALAVASMGGPPCRAADLSGKLQAFTVVAGSQLVSSGAHLYLKLWGLCWEPCLLWAAAGPCSGCQSLETCHGSPGHARDRLECTWARNWGTSLACWHGMHSSGARCRPALGGTGSFHQCGRQDLHLGTHDSTQDWA